MDIRLTLFGTLLFRGSDAPPPVRGDIPRAILTRLALSPGQPVSTEELVRSLWENPTDAVVSSLRAHISRLRSRGLGAVLSGGRSGYILDLKPDQIDVVAYAELVEHGAPDMDRMEELTAAERLWTGAPLASAAGYPFAAAEIKQLRELRRRAALELSELRLKKGEHALVVSTLTDLVSEYPDDDALVELFARALARSGRSNDALTVIDTVRPRSDGEHFESAGLGALRMAIVRQDPLVLGLALGGETPVERVGIPIPLTGFIGRRDDLLTVQRGRAESRLLTLTGPAGVGKTRLAVEVARSASHQVDQCQWLIDLAAVDRPEQVMGAVADSVGAAEHSVDAVSQAVGGRRTLLIVDNAEHVLGAVAALVAELLGLCSGLTVLVTSREAMGMAGERVVQLQPLIGAALSDAIELFLQRASDASGVTAWAELDIDRASQICIRLDGLPLAIELAAARLDVLSMEELAASLHSASDSDDGRGRHASVDEAIAWSVELLTAPEREMLAQIAQFSGPFGLDAVLGICETDGKLGAGELAVALARKSLISVVTSGSGVRRFRVLDSVKRFMRERHALESSERWYRRHATWMAELADEIAPRLRTSEAKNTKELLAAMRADMDDALQRLIEWRDRATAMKLVAALSWYWYERGMGADAVVMVDRTIALPGPDFPLAEATALRACTFMLSVGSDPLATFHYCARFSEAAERSGDAALRMLAHTMTAYLAGTSGQQDEIEEELAAAEALRGDVLEESRWAHADELLIRGDALRLLGRSAAALQVLGECYRLSTEIGHGWALKASCFVTGKVLIQAKRPRDAIGILRSGAVRSLETEDPTSALSDINVAAAAFVALDRAETAAELYGAVDSLGIRYNFYPQGSDAAFTERFREQARKCLTADEWETALARGRERDFSWLIKSLDAVL